MSIGDLLPTLYPIKSIGLEDRIHIVREEGKKTPLIVSVSPTYVAFSRKTVDPDYVDAFDAALSDMKADATYNAIFEKYGLNSPLP